MNGMELKIELKNAGRYDEVANLLRMIAYTLKDEFYPIKPYADETGSTVWRIPGSSVREEALRLLIYIEGNEEDQVLIKGFNFHNLDHYVMTHSDMLLHNYAVSISHRKDPEIDLEDIRSWCVLGSLIDSFDYPKDEWIIPEGWRKHGRLEK